jgi:hypothetical protein
MANPDAYERKARWKRRCVLLGTFISGAVLVTTYQYSPWDWTHELIKEIGVAFLIAATLGVTVDQVLKIELHPARQAPAQPAPSTRVTRTAASAVDCAFTHARFLRASARPGLSLFSSRVVEKPKTHLRCLLPQSSSGAGVAIANQYRAQGLNLTFQHAQFADGSVSVEAGLLEVHPTASNLPVFKSFLLAIQRTTER